ncbi:hypothetical protein [Bacillus sp. FJAT-27251]|uniref:hypothetical protein n=1 Tax=Bacillus sp. FJAT-27251 TaxID=1684142 RepID=UPI0006A7A84C|nr:hypothetical protein [Bacillus sp. FJAT-27251]
MAYRDTEQNENNVAHNIKEGAGAAFHAAHQGLEATENFAMNAVDQTSKAIKRAADNVNEMMDRDNENQE